MEMPIDQVLDNIANRLETAISDPKIGASLAYEVKRFNREYGKAIQEIRQCQNTAENLDRIVNAFIPEGKKLAQTIWQNFETYGLWNAESERIADLMEETLTPKRFINDATDAILAGCECRRKGQEKLDRENEQ